MPFRADAIAAHARLLQHEDIKSVYVDGIVVGVGKRAVVDRRPAFDGDEVRTVGVGADQPVRGRARGLRAGGDDHPLQRRPAGTAVFQDTHAGRRVQHETDKRRRGAILQHDRVGRAGADGDGIARRDGQLPRAAIVGAPRQLDLDQPVA